MSGKARRRLVAFVRLPLPGRCCRQHSARRAQSPRRMQGLACRFRRPDAPLGCEDLIIVHTARAALSNAASEMTFPSSGIFSLAAATHSGLVRGRQRRFAERLDLIAQLLVDI